MRLPFVLAAVLVCSLPALSAEPEQRPNVLLITLDDMNWDSLGCTGSKVPNVTPNIDRLASEGRRFLHAHVTIAVCQPCRSVWLTGRYPFNNGARGFEPIDADVPTLTERLREAGYFNGIMAKVSHLAPQRKFAWDVVVEPGQLGVGRNPDLYYQHATAFLAAAKKAEKPFFVMANSQDPHRPFARSAQEAGRRKPKKKPNGKRPAKASNYPGVSRTIRIDEVTVPAFLPDLPEIRTEIAEYTTSVHRADEIVGAVLRALDEAGHRDDTLVMFLSDHGMPLPFAKTNCWLNSTRTPWIVRWPGVVEPGAVDETHFVSGIDLTPTVLDAIGLEPLTDVDGRSFLPLLRGESQPRRTEVMTCFHRTSARRDYEMRSLVDAEFGYVWNPWSDGTTVFRNESQAGRTWKAMVAAANEDEAIAARVDLFAHRVPEEFYDYANDPAALRNLIDDPAHAERITATRRRLLKRMRSVDDPLADRFEEWLAARAAE